jgi:dTDP-4-amino-4,6-dideoxygalactose transaminase
MLAERLRWLPAFSERRRQIITAFRAGISNPRVSLMAEPEEDAAHVYHLFVVRCEQRDALQEHLRLSGVQSLIHYPVPVHSQEPCLAIRRDPMGLTRAELHARVCLSLPCHPQLSDDDVNRIIDAVNSF